MRVSHVAALRGDTRGRDGGVREELAARIGRVLINAQIAAPLLWHLLSNLPSHFFMEQQEWLSKKYRGS
jgi:hypothetical protein